MMNPNDNLERILESAVIVSWADLMRGAEIGLIHVEYGFAPAGSFALPANLGRQGLLQISTPTQPENAAAAVLVNKTSLDSPLAQPAVA